MAHFNDNVNIKTTIEKEDNKVILTTEQNSITSNSVPNFYRIVANDIIDITVNSYYRDLDLMEKGKRDLLKVIYMVYHKGFRTYDVITKEAFDYLVDNELINNNQIKYAFVDIPTGNRYYRDRIKDEPTLKVLEKLQQEALAFTEKQYERKSVTFRQKEVDIPVEDTTTFNEKEYEEIQNSEFDFSEEESKEQDNFVPEEVGNDNDLEEFNEENETVTEIEELDFDFD